MLFIAITFWTHRLRAGRNLLFLLLYSARRCKHSKVLWHPICVNLPQRSRGEKRTEVRKRGRQVGEDLLAMDRLKPVFEWSGCSFYSQSGAGTEYAWQRERSIIYGRPMPDGKIILKSKRNLGEENIDRKICNSEMRRAWATSVFILPAF